MNISQKQIFHAIEKKKPDDTKNSTQKKFKKDKKQYRLNNSEIMKQKQKERRATEEYKTKRTRQLKTKILF